MFYLPDVAAHMPFGLVASVIFLIIHEIRLRGRKERVSWFHRLMLLILGLYMTVVFAVTVSPAYGFSIAHFGNRMDLMPSQTLAEMLSNPMNFYGNILLFIPLGVLLVLLSGSCQKIYTSFFLGAALSLVIEALQLFISRGTDIDDVILNTAGTLCGYFLGRFILVVLPSLRKKVGILVEIDEKFYRKRNDARSIVLLMIFVLISVFASGFSIRTPDMQSPMTSRIKGLEVPRQPRKAVVQISEKINAKNALLLNVSSNTVMYEKESDQQIAPASTAKMLTALTVLDHCDADDEVIVGEEIERVAKDASRAWLYTGSRLTVRQLLDALLLPSGNDAAYTLAIFTGRKLCHDDDASIDKALEHFIEAMNKKAEDIGAVHSNFISPDGYDTAGQYTTTNDLAYIAKAFMSSGILREIAGSWRISDVWLNGREVTYYNTNKLIDPDSPYFYEHAAGLKTGNSEAAGSCLVSCAYIADELYICVVMGSTDEGRWLDSLTLYHAIG